MFLTLCFVAVIGITFSSLRFNDVYADDPPPGSQRVINMSDPHVYTTADAVVNLLNWDRGYSEIVPRMSLDNVLNGTVQVVDGEEYRLIFAVGDSVCTNDEEYATATTEQCPLQTRRVQRRKQCTCQAVYRNWESPPVDVINYECEDLPPIVPPRGGQVPVNMSDPSVNITAYSAVDSINRDRGYSDTLQRLSLYFVENGTVQIVDGEIFRLLFTIANSVCKNTQEHATATTEQCPISAGVLPVSKRCQAAILLERWVSPQTQVLTYECQDLPPPPLPPGGQMPINSSDPGVSISVDEAINVINRDRGYSDTTQRESLGKLENGTVQIVDGSLYRLKFTMGDSVCKNTEANENATTQQCPLLPNTLRLRDCEATILYKKWETPMCKVLTYACEKVNEKKTRRTSVTDASKVADFAVNEINRENGYSCCTYKYVVASVESSALLSKNSLGGQQSYYALTVKIGESFCTNNDLNKDRTANSCPLQPGLALKTCHMTVDVTPDNTVGLSLGRHTCGFATPTPSVR